MSASFSHTPVLLAEVLRFAAMAKPALIVDCTVGGGGHARELLRTFPAARLIGIDRDLEALAAARAALAPFGERVRLAHAPFSATARILSEVGWGSAGLVLADLGVSSHQLESPARGFSFRAEGPLDMRMDTSRGQSAAELIAELEVTKLARVIAELGEERHARKVAREIVACKPKTTLELAEAVRRVVPRGKGHIDPATRTFQAVRMLVNDELAELGAFLSLVPHVLVEGGVCLVISFHSLEDRAVKTAWRELVGGCVCPHTLPVCVCGGGKKLVELLTHKPVVAGAEELAANARSRSAKLRAVRRSGRAA